MLCDEVIVSVFIPKIAGEKKSDKNQAAVWLNQSFILKPTGGNFQKQAIKIY